jgi:DNA repair exonuclease SbcCD ATPase subunit
MTITPQEKARIENEIKNNFSELQKKLSDLQNEITNESDTTKKQEKQAEFDKMKSELDEMKKLIDRLSSLQEQDLQSLKTRIEEYMQVKQDTQTETADLLRGKVPTPTTYEILKDSDTYARLLNIIKSNPNEFIRLPGNTPEEKLEHMFSRIRESVVIFIKNKLGESEKYDNIINNTIAPALEWSMMEMLKTQ